MKSARKNHPCERIFICRDEINGGESSLRENFIRRDEISIAEGPAFSELPLGEIWNPTTLGIDPF